MKRTIEFMNDTIRDNGRIVYFKDGTALEYYKGEYILYRKGSICGIVLSVEGAFKKFDRDFDKLVTKSEFDKEEN